MSGKSLKQIMIRHICCDPKASLASATERWAKGPIFEEDYSGPSLRGSYNAGIYYPDKTRVGWWKNGYPEYFAKVLNSINWIGMSWNLNGETLDLNQCDVLSFKRELDMQNGLLSRFF